MSNLKSFLKKVGEFPDDGWGDTKESNARYDSLRVRETIFPEKGWYDGRQSPPLVDYHIHSKGDKLIPYLHLECPLKPGTGMNSVAEMIFNGLAEMALVPGQLELSAEYKWTAEAFQQETEIGSLSEIKFSAYHTEPPFKFNRLAMHWWNGMIDVSACGSRSRLWPQIIAELQPRSAYICLSPEDLVLWKSKTSSWWRWLVMSYQTLRPETKITVPLSWLEECERAIGKPLLSGYDDKSHIESIQSRLQPSRDASLEAMQRIAGLASSLAHEDLQISITGKIRATDPTLTKRFQHLPKQAIVTSLEVKNKALDRYNELGIDRLPNNKGVSFGFRVSPRDCPLLELQSKLCEEFGIVFPDVQLAE